MDLDGFKQINDKPGTRGKRSVAKGCRPKDKENNPGRAVAQVGGDEFILLLDNINSAENSVFVANKILFALSEPFDLKGQPGRVGGSIGISIFADDSENPVPIVKQADEAMYLAKLGGKNTSRFYRDVWTQRQAKSTRPQ